MGQLRRLKRLVFYSKAECVIDYSTAADHSKRKNLIFYTYIVFFYQKDNNSKNDSIRINYIKILQRGRKESFAAKLFSTWLKF